MTGVISGGGGITKVGNGLVIIGTSANTFTGVVNVNQGILEADIATSLGGIVNGVTVASGATLQITVAATVVGKQLTLNGTGFGQATSTFETNRGAFVTTAAVTWTGNITVNTSARQCRHHQ